MFKVGCLKRPWSLGILQSIPDNEEVSDHDALLPCHELGAALHEECHCVFGRLSDTEILPVVSYSIIDKVK